MRRPPAGDRHRSREGGTRYSRKNQAIGLHRARPMGLLEPGFARMAAPHKPNPINSMAQVDGSGTAGIVGFEGVSPPPLGGSLTKDPPGGREIPGGPKALDPGGTDRSPSGEMGTLSSGSPGGPSSNANSGGVRNSSPGLSGSGGNTLPNPRSTSGGGASTTLPGARGPFFVRIANVRSPGERSPRSPSTSSALAMAFARSCGFISTAPEPSATGAAITKAINANLCGGGKLRNVLFIF